MRDGHLKTDDFFSAEKFSTIKFKSTSFEKVGDSHYKIKGNLTIRDTTKEVTIDAVLNGIIPSGKGMRSGWKATLAVNRFDYGLKWDRTIETGGLVAGATVNLVFNLEFVKQ
jgi:polyisoprenoid-binding protein YceI